MATNYRSTKELVKFLREIGPVPELAEKFHTPNELGVKPEVRGFITAGDEARGDIGMFMDVSTTGWNIDLLQRDANGELIHDAAGNVIRKPETKLIKKLKQKVTTIIGKAEDGEDREIIETEIELYDAQAAKVHLGKHLKLFTDQVDVTSKGEKIGNDDTDTRNEILRKLASIATATGATDVSGKPDGSRSGDTGA